MAMLNNQRVNLSKSSKSQKQPKTSEAKNRNILIPSKSSDDSLMLIILLVGHGQDEFNLLWVLWLKGRCLGIKPWTLDARKDHDSFECRSDRIFLQKKEEVRKVIKAISSP